MSGLAKYEAARGALAECKSVDEVKGWADRAAATQAYARMAKDKGLEVDAAEIRIRAERRLGEMLREQKVSGGMATGAKGIGKSAVVANDRTPTLSELGVSKDLSARAQKIAAVPEPEFEAEVAGWRDRVEEEGVRVSARLEAAGAQVEEGEGYSEEDQAADHAADFEAMSLIIGSDDKLSAAMEEIRKAKAIAATSEALYASAGRELASMKREAQRWMRKAKKSAACQNCMTALERE
jgi:hypothetical protein